MCASRTPPCPARVPVGIAGVDAKTRRQIIGHKTGSMDDRYTIVGDEDLEAATIKMNAYQKERGLMSEYEELKSRLDA